MSRLRFIVATGIVLGATTAFEPAPMASASSGETIDATCETGSSPYTLASTTLDTATPARSGIVYDGTTAALKLQRNAGIFNGTLLGVSNKILSGCAADFDGDGWTDFIGIGTGADAKLIVYKNQTYDNPEPADWYNPLLMRTPKFVPGPTIYTDTTIGTVVTGCADVNGDGKMDVVLAYCNAGTTVCTPPSGELIFLGNGDRTFQPPYTYVASKASLLSLAWSTNSLAFVDYNGDGKIDMVWGIPEVAGATGGKVIVALNDGAAQPKFDTQPPITVVANAGFGVKGPDAISVADFTGDGVPDIVIGGVSSAYLRLFPGLLGAGFGPFQNIGTGFAGGATAILAGDFSLSGKKDIIVGTDGAAGYYTGCNITYDKNGGTSTPFAAGSSWSKKCASTDLDMGWVFDYDHDPQNTPDLVMADGNNSGTYFLFANRVTSLYVNCGTVDSTTMDIGDLASKDMTITDVRISPTPAATPASDGTIGWEASNDGGNSWHPATACSDNPNQYCVTFGSTVGKQIRWRATMCSNTSGTAHTRTPTITGVSTTYTYVTAQNHFRAGPIAQDGIVYVGAFREPGDWGHVYAMSDALGTTLWDAASVLDATATSARNIYTVASDGTPLAFSTAGTSDAKLRSTLLASSATIANQIVTWATSARFGLDTLHVLGSVENSTPALLGPPKQPYWYTLPTTNSFEKTLANVYVNANTNRQQLLLVGAKDGMLHAFYTNPADATDPKNGHEAWAFVPYDVAQRMGSDKTTGIVTAYPDGSPTLVNAKVYANWRSIVVMPEANGGRSVFALDVTDTVQGSTVSGPTPLWQFSDPAMGSTYSKPTVIRTKVGGAEKWMAIFASGPGTSGQGGVVYSLDLSSGALLWKFDIGDPTAYVSSDITASETDDEASTSVDGYIDRVFFADNRGRVWKLDPGAAVSGVMDSVDSNVDVGLPHKALFSTKVSAGALGTERAVAGTLTAATDASNRLVLFFGTGGTEDTPAGAQNAFYAVYADTGTVRSKLDASTGLAAGVKFYGGVVYQSGQIVFTQGQDLSGLGLCAPTAGSIVAIDANTFATQFTTNTSSKIVAPVFAQNGEIYTVTLKGQLMASGFTGSTGSGSDSSGHGGSAGSGDEADPASGPTDTGSVGQPFTILSWRQTY